MNAFRLITAVACAASLLISTQTSAATSPVGATAGQFRVSESGSATYNIPIAMPPGTAGMQPSLSLDYNSQGGNGLLGVGWSLGGLSAISRCPQTQAQDGVRGSVNYDGNDRFCLEGQRLIVVSGAYGANGTEYRTEIESYSRIVSYGTAGNGPAYFKVWAKSGQVMEYGVTADSRIEAQGKSSVAVWALDKVQDTVGNYLTVTYTEDNANGQYYPARIDYTGNAGKGLAPYNSVQFVYEARPDVTPLYSAGSLMKTTVRLKNVQTYAGSPLVLVKNFQLAYDGNSETKRSRLLSLTECTSDGACLQPTSLAWLSAGVFSLGADSTWGTRSASYNTNALGFHVGDVNGDGLPDLVYDADGGQMHVLLNTGSGFGTDVIWGTRIASINTNAGGYRLIDVNGDGKADIVYDSLDNGNYVRVMLSDGTKFIGDSPWGIRTLPYNVYAGGWQIVDVNGDGLPDVVYEDSVGYKIRVLLNNGSSFGVDTAWGTRSAAYNTNALGFQLVDMNGDGLPDLVYDSDGNMHCLVSNNKMPDLLGAITNGLNAVTTLSYEPLTNNSVYTKGSGSKYPILDLQIPMYVVSSSSASDGIGGNYQMNYHYNGMKAELNGRGSLGFHSMDITDPQTGIVTHNEYRQDYPYIGAASRSTKTLNGTLLNQAQNTYTATPLGGTRYQVMLAQTVESSYELNGGLVTTMTTNTQYDAYGNPTQIVISTNDGYTKTSNNTYTNDTANWLLGRLTLATVTSATPNAGTLTRTSSFAYNPANGLLTQEVVEPNNSALRLQTDYSYDGYGNKQTVTVSGAGITSRTTTSLYDSRGQFPATTTNALNQSDTGTYDARFGKPATLTGPNGLTTTWSYDGFGRKVNEARADGTQSSVAYYNCDATCPNFAKYYVSNTTAGAPSSYAYFDMLGREVRMAVQGFDGRLIIKDTYYDSMGRVDRVTKPYYSGDSPLYYYNQYDVLGRVLKEISADNSTKQMSYNGLVSSMTNSLGQTETKTKNSQGQLVSVTDNLGNVISYLYDPFGNLLKTTDPKGNVTSLTYDLRGRKIAMNDPDMGAWSYQYNVLGELLSQTDAKGQVTSMSYDVLGRILARNEPDLKSTWSYDSATKGIGKLAKSTADNGFQRTYTYDGYGRVASETSTIDTTYSVSKSYDAYGRVSVLTYPTGVAIKNVYNAYGYLSEVRNNADNALFWKGNAKDADGHVINETLGNGLTTTRTYTNSTGRVASIAVGGGIGSSGGTPTIQNQSFAFDSLGNLIYRYDPLQGQSEAFGYDGMNRLTTATQGAVTSTVAYDSIGNITNKSDVGNYTYGAKPHAVTQVAGTLNTAYTYDANGNLTSGAGRTLTLTSYNLPSRITQGANSVDFLYDADHMRMRKTSATETSIYLNPRIDQGLHFEKEVKGGVTTYKHYIYGAAGLVGVHTTSSAASPKTSYFHQDHLGSVVAVTDDSATVIARFKFDPWGKRLLLAGDAEATHHGFTGHEHLDEVGLIHANGRIYDPILARFMSADPYIQSPDNLQSYNRYSYVWNNPLSATDPSGYFSLKKLFKATIRFSFNPSPKNTVDLIRNQPGQKYADQALLKYPLLRAAGQIVAGVYGGPIGAAAYASYIAGLQGGGNFAIAKAGAISYATSYAFYVVGSVAPFADAPFANIAGHAAVGCLSAVAGGGGCGSGAAAAGLGAVASGLNLKGVEGLVVASVAGGVGAELGGGKFANGAVTGAFGYLFNKCGHEDCFGKDESDIKFTYGFQGGARIGLTKILGAKLDIDTGSREFSLINGKQYVNENYTLSIDVAGFSIGLDASRNSQIFSFVRGKDSISSKLSGQPFEVKPFVQTPYNLSSKELFKIDIGASFGIGLEATLDFRDLIGK